MREEAVFTARSTTLAYDDLRDWIKTLEKHGELKRIREEVSPELEITEITDRVSKIGSRSCAFRRNAGPSTSVAEATSLRMTGQEQYAPGGPALLFENVKGHPGHKVLINQFGSERRMAMALGVERLDEIAERISGLMNVKAPEGLLRQAEDAAATGRADECVSEDGPGEGCAV